MNYNINNNFCDRETAKDIIDFCLEFGEPFSYKPTEVWDCRRMYDSNFKERIIDLLTTNYKNGDFKLWFDYSTFNLKNFKNNFFDFIYIDANHCYEEKKPKKTFEGFKF